MSPVDWFLFGVLPYISLATLVVGVLYRTWRWVSASGATGLYSVSIPAYRWGFSARGGEVLKRIFLLYTLTTSDRLVLVGSFLFHWGIWVALLGHLSMLIPPENFGMPKEVHKAVALYVGGAAGVLAMIGLVILLVRRLARADVRRLSFLDDWFALLLLLALVALGNYQTLVVHPNYMETVSPWLQSIFTGEVAKGVSLMAEADPATKAHAFLAMLFMMYVPLGKMIHPFSFIAMPTLWSKPTELYGYTHPKIEAK